MENGCYLQYCRKHVTFGIKNVYQGCLENVFCFSFNPKNFIYSLGTGYAIVIKNFFSSKIAEIMQFFPNLIFRPMTAGFY